MNREDIDFSRGDEDIVFIHTEVDTEAIGEAEEPREKLLSEMKDRGLELVDAPVTAMFSDEFAVHLQEDSEIIFEGEKVYPRD